MMHDRGRMKLLKSAFGVVLLLILVSNIWTISKWNESRGVYDDVCYLRQAHLFQQLRIYWLSRVPETYSCGKIKSISN
jgi:hypothetical protein